MVSTKVIKSHFKDDIYKSSEQVQNLKAISSFAVM